MMPGNLPIFGKVLIPDRYEFVCCVNRLPQTRVWGFFHLPKENE